METETLHSKVLISGRVASFIGSGINGNLKENNLKRQAESRVASFIGSGINGNLYVDNVQREVKQVASFIGSGINGNFCTT